MFIFRTRGLASGITAALNYVLTFIATKSYFHLETKLSLPGVTLFNCVVIAMGLILMYNILPETEGRTLEEIEMHFSDKSKNILDHKIRRAKAKQETANGSNQNDTISSIPMHGIDGVTSRNDSAPNAHDTHGNL